MRSVLFRLPLRQCPRAQWTRGDLASRLCIQFNSTLKGSAQNSSLKATVNPARQILRPPRSTQIKPETEPKKAITKPQQVIIYHAGTGRIAFIGTMRITTILIFAVSCAVVAPAFYFSEDTPWFTAPAIVVGGSIPMLFVLFTSAPFVNHVYLAIPTIAQQTRQRTQAYLKNVPRNATLNIETMKLNFYPRRTEVSLEDLIPARSKVRPVSFMHTKPQPQPWWKGKSPIYFYAPEKSKHGARATLRYFPEVWEGVFAKIKANRP
ncbi:hypothetical protein FQN51_001690 [Onygenales sp. PD_10]|nr:hypothetical protein FQN51_001690 [Onygenales sp. PD_10]